MPLLALDQERQALAWAHEINHLGSIVHAMDYQLMHRALRRDLREVFDYAGALASFTEQHDLADHHAKSLIFRGWAVALGEDPAAGLALLEQGLARQRDIGTDEDFPLYVSLHAEALVRNGRPERAVTELQSARADFERLGLKATVPELLRELGEATLAVDPSATAQALALFADAGRMAAGQGAAMLEMRAAISAARLHLRLGTAELGARELARSAALVSEDTGGIDWRRAVDLLALFRRLGVLPG
jgi:predicted ATPase